MTNESTNTLDRRVDDKRPSGPLQWDGEASANMNPPCEVMIDTETLGTTPGSAILSIGAVMFGPTGLGESFYAPIQLSSCTDVGLAIDPNTIAWWMSQSDEARAAAFPQDAAPLPQVLFAFANWFDRQGADRPWCHGATFDVPLLEAAYKACGIAPPWKFWNVRDTRTLYDLSGVKPDRSKGTHHNALDDAENQAEAAVRALRILGDRVATIAPPSAALASQSQANPSIEDPANHPDALWMNYPGAVTKKAEQPLYDGNGEPWNEAAEKSEQARYQASQSQAAQPTELAAAIEAIPDPTIDGYGQTEMHLVRQGFNLARKAAAHIAGTSQATQQPTADLADDDRYQHVRDLLLDAMGAADAASKAWLNTALDLLSDIATDPKRAAGTSQATKAQAEPIYQEMCGEFGECWGDTSKGGYDAANEQGITTRIVYAAPVAKEAPAVPELTVWYGSMPESNGASNFTATLMRKGASAFDTDSYTFSRSEYPDRVRYEADCMHYLIGELAERPDILDYDADKHSGYIEPVASVAKEATRDTADLRTFLLNHITSHELEGRKFDRLTLAHNEVHLLREMMGEAATRDAEQPIIGKLLDQMTQLQMLFPDGCQEPGALVRFSEVTKVLVNASKQQANVLLPFAAPAGQRDAVVAQLASALRSANLLLAETFISTGKDVGERASKVSYQIEMALATASDDALASGFREGRNTKPESTESGSDIATTTSTVSAPTDAQKGSSHE